MSVTLVYVTASSKAEAMEIGKKLVEAKLAACVNIIERMHSIYWWKGKMEESEEVVLIAKTTAEAVEGLMEAVRESHSYSVPCMLTIPVTGGSKEYLDWLHRNVKNC